MEKEIWINARFLTQQKSGVQQFAMEISRELLKINTKIKFIAPKNIINTKVTKEFNVINIGSNSGTIWEQIDLPKFLKKNNNPLLINLCNTAPLNYKNNIVAIHDLAFIENPKWFSFAFRNWYNYLVPKIAKKAKHIITVSEFSKKEIITKLNLKEGEITVIYNGLSRNLISFKKHNSNISHKENIIICVGSFNPRKNLEPLINTFSKLNLADYQLLIVGGKDNNFNNEGTNQFPENIKMLGYINDDELFKLYQKSQLLIYPSLYEGFGIPIIEALYFGCPVLVSNLVLYKELFSSYDLNYIKGDHKEYYTKELKNILHNQTSQTNTSHKIKEEFSYEQSAFKLNDLIEKLQYK